MKIIRGLLTMRLVWGIATMAICSSCNRSNPYFDPAKAHHTESGFRNVYDQSQKSFWTFWKWRWHRWTKERDDPSRYHFETGKHDVAFLKKNRSVNTITWVGHSTFLVQLQGINILTDPQFSKRASPFSFYGPMRVMPPGLAISDLPNIDMILISHDHYDHLDIPSMQQLKERFPNSLIVAPLGHKSWFEKIGVRSGVVELDWWSEVKTPNAIVTAVPVQHWCRRGAFDRNRRLWSGWVVEIQGKRMFFSGDAGMSPHFHEIGEKFKRMDLSILPIGAYEPRWFMKSSHMNPEESVEAHVQTHSKLSVGGHWGTFFGLTDEPMDEPPKKLTEVLHAKNLSEKTFFVLKHGETRNF